LLVEFGKITMLRYAVVYLVDVYDQERFDESKKELDALLSNV